MKTLARQILKFSVCLALVLFLGQTVSGQGNECGGELSFDEILTKFTIRKTISAEPVNKELIGQVIKRKTDIELSAANEKTLRDAGASEVLVKAIRENVSAKSVEAVRLYRAYVENYQSEKIENLKIALDAAKEYIRKFENDGCNIEVVKYFKDAVLVLEEKFPHPHPPVNPKNKLKYELLKELTGKFKAKKWDEVFALGRKVYEIDPELTPLFTELASLGFEQAELYGDKSKYNAETVFYAELAVKLMRTSTRDFNVYGALGYPYKTKAEALARMNEILDYMKSRNLSEVKIDR